NSITRLFPGSWKSSPGVNRTNRTKATTTGPQSPISQSSELPFLLLAVYCLLSRSGEDGGVMPEICEKLRNPEITR
ncbi:hypothetical protein H0E87_031280, partial [Populus deltoides]